MTPHPASRRRPRATIHMVTNATRSRYADVDARTRRYLITMGVRVACVLLAIFLPVPVWARVILLFGAVFLPWLAVIEANGGQTQHPPSDLLLGHIQQAQLASDTPEGPGARVIEGEVEGPGYVSGDTTPRRRSA